ncbi:MAG TPA: ParB/RepB/Spo0J family partition protein [Candidatus Paceibacterota bacterium]|nr:ParB/RepB/Spo0J family partition protein [Candidatus Paceibacterota bacterium]
MELKTIPINKIKPNKSQPRDNFDKEKIKELAESILSNGLINPIIIRKEKADYIIVAGERRYMACKILKKKEIEAFVKEYKQDIDWKIESLIENLQREDLNSLERENYIYAIWKTGKFKTHIELSKRIGYTSGNGRTFISDLIYAKEERDRLKKAGIRTPSINTEIMKKIKTLDEDTKIKVIKKIENKEIIPQRAKEIIPILRQSTPEVKKALLDEDITTEQAERIIKLKRPEDRTKAINEHKSIAVVEKGIERNIDREMSAKEKKVFDKQLLQAGNWILSFRNSVTEANSKIKDAIKTLLLSTKFIQVMDTKQKEKLDSELERFIAKLDEGLQLAEQIQSKI